MCLLCSAWVEQLENEGWFKSEPTLWLAEGLLMYLEQAASEQLLQDMSGMLSAGSTINHWHALLELQGCK